MAAAERLRATCGLVALTYGVIDLLRATSDGMAGGAGETSDGMAGGTADLLLDFSAGVAALACGTTVRTGSGGAAALVGGTADLLRSAGTTVITGGGGGGTSADRLRPRATRGGGGGGGGGPPLLDAISCIWGWRGPESCPFMNATSCAMLMPISRANLPRSWFCAMAACNAAMSWELSCVGGGAGGPGTIV